MPVPGSVVALDEDVDDLVETLGLARGGHRQARQEDDREEGSGERFGVVGSSPRSTRAEHLAAFGDGLVDRRRELADAGSGFVGCQARIASRSVWGQMMTLRRHVGCCAHLLMVCL